MAEEARQLKRTLPPNPQSYRGPNHVLISRRASRKATCARVRKLIDSGRWPEVHLHGLGAALALTISLAAELVEESGGKLVASTTTSTEVLVDQPDGDGGEDGNGALRLNSAVHVALKAVRMPKAKPTRRSSRKRGRAAGCMSATLGEGVS